MTESPEKPKNIKKSNESLEFFPSKGEMFKNSDTSVIHAVSKNNGDELLEFDRRFIEKVEIERTIDNKIKYTHVGAAIVAIGIAIAGKIFLFSLIVEIPLLLGYIAILVWLKRKRSDEHKKDITI